MEIGETILEQNPILEDNQIVINNADLGEYLHFKKLGYRTLWVGNGLICLIKR